MRLSIQHLYELDVRTIAVRTMVETFPVGPSGDAGLKGTITRVGAGPWVAGYRRYGREPSDLLG